MNIRTVVAIGGILLLSVPAFVAEGRVGVGGGGMRGRGRRPPTPPVPQASTVDGTIDKVEKGMVLVTTGESSGGKKNNNQNNQQGQQRQTQAPAGQQWLVTTTANTKIMVNGTANPDYLRVGLYVDFKAQYDGKTIPDKLSELTVVSNSPDRPAGIYPGGAGLDSILPPADGGQGAAKAKKGKKNAKGGDAQGGAAAGASGMTEIIGRVTSYKDNKMTVLAKKGEKALKVELSETPRIAVALSDLSVAKPGDKITAKGKKSGTQPTCMADEVTVTLSEPLSGKKRPAAAAKPDASKSDKAKSDDDKPVAGFKAKAPAKADGDSGDKADDK